MVELNRYFLEVKPVATDMPTRQPSYASLRQLVEGHSLVESKNLLEELSLLENGSPVEMTVQDLVKQLCQQSQEAHNALNPDGSSFDVVSWKHHEQDLRQFSALYPQCIFSLEVVPDSRQNWCKKYFCAGKMQVALAQITFDQFQAEKAV